jgi:NADPH:quinone reductase-like Zn-dependent oxidoreductase
MVDVKAAVKAAVMRAALFSEFGGADVLRVVADAPVPEPAPGWVRLRVGAAALNHLDVWVRRGLPIDITMPHIGGSDIAGTVDALGEGVEGLGVAGVAGGAGVAGVAGVSVGARVVVDPSVSCGTCEWCLRGDEPLCLTFKIIGEHLQGGFAEYVTVPARNLFVIPDAFSFEIAAAAPLPFLTAWRALVGRAALQSGESVLITGASGGVSTAAIQIAKFLGARVHAVTSSRWVDRVRALGADVVYNRDDGDWSKALLSETSKRGVDVIIDSVGAAAWPQNLRALARGGRLVVYGGTAGPKVEIDVRALFWKQTSIMGSTMSSHAEFNAAMRHVFDGTLRPVVDSVLPLERVREAHERLEAGDVFGKVVLTPVTPTTSDPPVTPDHPFGISD